MALTIARHIPFRTASLLPSIGKVTSHSACWTMQFVAASVVVHLIYVLDVTLAIAARSQPLALQCFASIVVRRLRNSSGTNRKWSTAEMRDPTVYRCMCVWGMGYGKGLGLQGSGIGISGRCSWAA